MELWNLGDLCNCVGDRWMQTTTLRGEPLDCSLYFIFLILLSPYNQEDDDMCIIIIFLV
jgi:hypothetical protein